MNSCESAKYQKNSHFGWKIIFFIALLRSSWLSQPTIFKWIELEPWDWSQMKDNWIKIVHLHWNLLIFWYLMTLLMIWDIHHQNSWCKSEKNQSKFFQIVENCQFFKRYKIYDKLSVIWDQSQGCSSISLNMAGN